MDATMGDPAGGQGDNTPELGAQELGAQEMGAPESLSDEDMPFDAPVRTDPSAVDADVAALVVNLDGFEGPLDVLLELARAQKVDLRRISMLALVEQYLAFVEAAKSERLELAADYLVMAAWLAFLKSKLLLPVLEEAGDEPTADEMAARLAFQLQRLEAMRKSSEALFNLPQKGVDFFTRGAPEGVKVVRTPEWQADLFDLLQAYAKQRVSSIERTYKVDPPKVMTIEEARTRLARMLGAIPDWVDLKSLVLVDQGTDVPEASRIASAFNAALEFAKNGKIDLRQLGHYEPLYIKPKVMEDGPQNGQTGHQDRADQQDEVSSVSRDDEEPRAPVPPDQELSGE